MPVQLASSAGHGDARWQPRSSYSHQHAAGLEPSWVDGSPADYDASSGLAFEQDASWSGMHMFLSPVSPADLLP
jgi:hypothetical protein